MPGEADPVIDERPRVLVTVTDGIGRLRLDRPDKRNAIDRRMVEETAAALRDFVRGHVTVAVIEASGPVFCAGGDRAEAGTGARSATDLAMLVATTPVYVAARIHGGAIGGAVALAAACPLVVCTPDAWFDLPEARAGFLPTPVLAFLEPLLGPRRSLNLCLFPERIDATRAVELGLADHVVPTGGIDSFIEERLRGLAAAPGLAAAATSAWQDHFRTQGFRARFAQLMAALPA